ncbi:MAG: Holliday junction resolvase RuvX [Nitratireductor sp.]
MGNVIEIEALPALHTKNMRIIGLDLGTKTIGVAVSDGLLSIGSSLKTIKRSKFSKDMIELNEIVEHQQAFAIIIGLPLNMDGSEGPRVQATRAFVRNMGAQCALPVVFWDERLSTVAAERAMIEADMSRKKRAEKIDAQAAAFILQGALDRLSQLRSHSR